MSKSYDPRYQVARSPKQYVHTSFLRDPKAGTYVKAHGLNITLWLSLGDWQSWVLADVRSRTAAARLQHEVNEAARIAAMLDAATEDETESFHIPLETDVCEDDGTTMAGTTMTETPA